MRAMGNRGLFKRGTKPYFIDRLKFSEVKHQTKIIPFFAIDKTLISINTEKRTQNDIFFFFI